MMGFPGKANKQKTINSFTKDWLSGSDFHAATLGRIVKANGITFPSDTKQRTKSAYAELICNALSTGELGPEKVIEYYVKESRPWLSFRLGTHGGVFHQYQDPSLLVSEFGTSGWYGPVVDSDAQRAWYIRVSDIKCHTLANGKTLSQTSRRWTVIAEVTDSYLALSWRGFSQTSKILGSNGALQTTQYPFWNDIPTVYRELTDNLNGQWEDQNLFDLILNSFWEKYREHPKYDWLDLRVRADKFGVIVNAHSSRVKEISGKGLRAFSSKLAQVAVNALSAVKGMTEAEAHKKAENAIIRTLVKDWGTKSYEFSLDEKVETHERTMRRKSVLKKDEPEFKPVFLAHCFFGEDLKAGTQDGLQHLHCGMSHGGSESTLKFLLRELLSEEDPDADQSEEDPDQSEEDLDADQ